MKLKIIVSVSALCEKSEYMWVVLTLYQFLSMIKSVSWSFAFR